MNRTPLQRFSGSTLQRSFREHARHTLELYRTALKLRHELQADEDLEWVENANPEILHFRRPGGWQSVTNFGDTAVDLPEGTVLVSSAPLEDGKLPGNTTAWLR